MSASARTRPSLEPLAAPLVGLALLHILVGFVVLNILPDLQRKSAAKNASKLFWMAPADFLVDKKIPSDQPIATATTKPPVSTDSSNKSMPLLPLVSAPTAAAPAALIERQQLRPGAVVPPGAVSLWEKSLAPILPSNRGPLPPVASSDLTGLETLPPTINHLAPMVTRTSDSGPTNTTVSEPLPARSTVPVAPPAAAPSSVTTTSSFLSHPKEANKYITLSAILPPRKASAQPKENQPALNLLDVAKLNARDSVEQAEASGVDMGAVEKALQQCILKEWTAPSIQSVPPSQRRATMEVAILRDGRIADASIKTASGSSLLDASIRQAADRLKKIPVTLPSNFPKERYEVRVNFLIE